MKYTFLSDRGQRALKMFKYKCPDTIDISKLREGVQDLFQYVRTPYDLVALGWLIHGDNIKYEMLAEYEAYFKDDDVIRETNYAGGFSLKDFKDELDRCTHEIVVKVVSLCPKAGDEKVLTGVLKIDNLTMDFDYYPSERYGDIIDANKVYSNVSFPSYLSSNFIAIINDLDFLVVDYINQHKEIASLADILSSAEKRSSETNIGKEENNLEYSKD